MTSESIHDVTDVIRSAARTLHDADIDTPEHDAKLLLAEACGRDLRDIDKAMLWGSLWDGLPREHASFDAPDAGAASSDSSATVGDAVTTALARFHAMIARRAAREPLQYITGHAPFRYLDLEVGPGVFIPRPETETVVQAGIDWLTRERLSTPRIVDLCAGSGAIGLSLVTEARGAQVWAVEKVPRTYDWTMRNWRRISRLDPLAADNYHLELGDATSGTTLAQFDGTIDMVVTNPPYIPEVQIPEQPEVRDHDPKAALYGGSADGTLIPERIVMRAAGLLRPGGVLVMEHDISQGPRLVSFAQANGFGQAYTGRRLDRPAPVPVRGQILTQDLMPWPGRAGADHAALADRHAADHRHIAAEPAVRPDHDRLAILVVVIRPVSRTPHVAVLEPDRMHRRQQLVQYRGSAGMVSPRQRVEPGAQVACALSHSGELGVGGIVEFAGEHFLALAGGYGRVSRRTVT